MAAGAGVLLLAEAAVGASAVFGAARNMRYASDMSGDYELDVRVAPGRQHIGYGQVIAFRLFKDKRPLPDATITVSIQGKASPKTESFRTDAMGIAAKEFVYFSPQTVTFTAVYKSSDGTTVQTSATATWCACGTGKRN